ncbi:hypothetical protein Tco_0562040 [Tanacetum coccineum]
MVLCSSGKSPSYGLPATNFSKLRIILLVFSCLSIAWIIAPVLSLSLCRPYSINTQQSVLFVFVLVNETSGIGLCCIVDKCKLGLGYNAVPPPYTGNFMPPKPDLSFSGLEEFVNEPIVSEPTVKKPVVETSEAKTSADKPKEVRKNNGAPIIED